MCDPVTIASTAIAVVSAGVSAYATNSQADAQAKAMEQQAAAEREEIYSKTEEELGERIREARKSRSRARVAAGESGAMGQSFAATINQSIQDQNMTSALVAKNAAFADRAVQDRLSVGKSQIRRVSSAEAGLNLASAGISGYRTGLSLRDASKGSGTTT